MRTNSFSAGGYRFIGGVFQYSAGVAAMPGYRILRVRFKKPVPLYDGFRQIEEILHSAGRPLTSFCACELRSPAPFTEETFEAFNRTYVGTLERWGLYNGKVNPVARSNVCPIVDPPSVPSFHAFAFTEPTEEPSPSFVISGSAEAPEGRGPYRDHTVRLGDLSPDGLRQKIRFVLGEMERRLQAFGFSWQTVSTTQIYTIHDFHPFLRDEILLPGAGRSDLTWHLARPPVVDLEFEMDCRGLAAETIV